MHPARSIVFFTTATGAGYGLLFILGLGAALGLLPTTPGFGAIACGLGLLLATIGLGASTFHLGHPERAWRALGQWRSSWLSREGVAALLTYPPALALAWSWAVESSPAPAFALLTAAGALLTVICTAMIYASLKPISRWAHPLTLPSYLLFALATGFLGVGAAAALAGESLPAQGLIATAALFAAWLVKVAWWHKTDRAAPIATIGQATGLGRFGRVSMLDPPHTESNYLLHEMGFRLARKHAGKLRRLAVLLGGLLPAVLAGMAAGGGGRSALLACLALFCGLAGVFVERWLFFAEARHTVMLYYGSKAV